MSAIRPAVPGDERALAQIDRDTWSPSVTPAPRWPTEHRFFMASVKAADVLVAEAHGRGVGYVKLGTPTPLASNRHVAEIRGTAVHPSHQRGGIGTQLLSAAINEAGRRGARRLTLRVLSTNLSARRLYEAAGFEPEGVLREEFLIDGSYVDDLLMAIRTGP